MSSFFMVERRRSYGWGEAEVVPAWVRVEEGGEDGVGFDWEERRVCFKISQNWVKE